MKIGAYRGIIKIILPKGAGTNATKIGAHNDKGIFTILECRIMIHIDKKWYRVYTFGFSEVEMKKEECREQIVLLLIDELPSLRAKIGISQDELAEYVGVSRQTMSAIERRKRSMTWQVALAVILFFTLHPKTNAALKLIPGFTDALKTCFDYNEIV